MPRWAQNKEAWPLTKVLSMLHSIRDVIRDRKLEKNLEILHHLVPKFRIMVCMLFSPYRNDGSCGRFVLPRTGCFQTPYC